MTTEPKGKSVPPFYTFCLSVAYFQWVHIDAQLVPAGRTYGNMAAGEGLTTGDLENRGSQGMDHWTLDTKT